MAKKKIEENIDIARSGVLRQELIDFIKREDSYYRGVCFDRYTDELLYTIATFVDTRAKADREEKLRRTDEQACKTCIDGVIPCLKYSKNKKGKLICYTPAHSKADIKNANKKGL
jgi:hypothetical protein